MMNLMEQLPFLSQLPPFLQSLVMNLILFIVAILLILLLRKVLTLIIVRPLRALANRSSNLLDNNMIDELLPPLRVAVVGIALVLTVYLIDFGDTVKAIAEVLSRTLIISAAFYALFKIFGLVAFRPGLIYRTTGITIPDRLLPFLNTLIKMLIIILGIIFVLQELRFDVGALIASLGVIGIGISLASQDTVSNVFSFAAIVADNPFQVGDFIKTPDVSGIVEQVGTRSTRVRQLDQALVTVPNSMLTNTAVLNWSRLSKRRINFTIGVTYETSSEQMSALVYHIREILKSHEAVDQESIVVEFVEFGASSLDVIVICFVGIADWGQFTAKKAEINLQIMELVEELGLSFAFPSQSIYIENMPGTITPEVPLTLAQRRMLHIPKKSDESHQEEGTGDVDDQIGDEEPQQK